MLVDISVILSGPMAIIIASVLTISAIIGKWLAAFFTQLAFRYSHAQRQLIFGLSSAHAAATLAVILVGYKAGILDENILNGTIILILVTCIVASFATEKAAKRILLTEQDDQEVAGKGSGHLINEHILLPIANLSNIEKLVEFALLIKDKKSPNPVSILTIVPNNAEAELNLMTARKKLEEYIKQGAASEMKVNAIATLDHNPAGGIARISKEIMADIVVLGWPKKAGIMDKLTGERINAIINNVDKNLFVCFTNKPFIAQKRIIIVSPPLSEREFGFETWLKKIAKLAQELTIPIVHFGNKTTQEVIKTKIKKKYSGISITCNLFEEWDNFGTLVKFINNDDLLILVSARKNSISYHNYLDSLPSKLGKLFTENDKIIVYPQQYAYLQGKYEHFSSNPLLKGYETVESIGKGIGNIFKRDLS
jgi:hypothetical protein